MREACIKSIFSSLLDVGRSIEIRFTYLKVNYVAALSLKLTRPRQCEERSLGAKAALTCC